MVKHSEFIFSEFDILGEPLKGKEVLVFFWNDILSEHCQLPNTCTASLEVVGMHACEMGMQLLNSGSNYFSYVMKIV